MSDTPQTDKRAVHLSRKMYKELYVDDEQSIVSFVPAGFARRLERQNADLLKALQAIVDLDDGDKPDLWHFEKEFNDARAAIQKATGDTNV